MHLRLRGAKGARCGEAVMRVAETCCSGVVCTVWAANMLEAHTVRVCCAFRTCSSSTVYALAFLFAAGYCSFESYSLTQIIHLAIKELYPF